MPPRRKVGQIGFGMDLEYLDPNQVSPNTNLACFASTRFLKYFFSLALVYLVEESFFIWNIVISWFQLKYSLVNFDMIQSQLTFSL